MIEISQAEFHKDPNKWLSKTHGTVQVAVKMNSGSVMILGSGIVDSWTPEDQVKHERLIQGLLDSSSPEELKKPTTWFD